MSSPMVLRRCCWFAAALLAVTVVAVDDDGGGAVKRNDPLCPADGCSAIRCPPDDGSTCPLGLVPDGCDCCPYGVCGQGDAVQCNSADRPCANNLECVKTEEISDTTVSVYRCTCKEKELVCGSDNTTYSNVCQLNEKAAKFDHNETLWMQYLGPCQSVAIIKTVPKNVAGTIGQPVVFDCEVKGFPVPSISWQFTNTHGITSWLPGDDTLIAIQTRGGPDRLTVTSWVQIMEFKPFHTGNYTCLGTNSRGTATASAILHIRKMV